jgi:hypothetical protein
MATRRSHKILDAMLNQVDVNAIFANDFPSTLPAFTLLRNNADGHELSNVRMIQAIHYP